AGPVNFIGDSHGDGIQQNRHIPLVGQSNFRDIGGYSTTDGRTVKWGQVYRTGELPRLTDEDVAILEKLDLQMVHNFLLDEEIAERGEDLLPDKTLLVKNPIKTSADDLVLAVVEARKTGDFSLIPPDLNKDVHRILALEGREEYAAMIRALSDPQNRPFAYHCSHGVHRTGTATAILLSALGVPWENVREDYLLSNTYRAEENERRIKQLTSEAAKTLGIPEEDVDTTNIVAFYLLQGDYIDGTLEVINQEYGSMDKYLKTGLGLSQDEIDVLKEQLLE
ncbi:MAG: tyrosine-protein phosphatase, partial [Desulfobulbia bacterium]